MVSLQTLILLSVALLCLHCQHGSTQTSVRFADGVHICTITIKPLRPHHDQLVLIVYTIPDLCSNNQCACVDKTDLYSSGKDTKVYATIDLCTDCRV